MLSLESYTRAMIRECRICQHLFTKLPEGTFDYRPTPGQRSTLELLKYLAIIGIASARCFAENSWEFYKGYSERVAEMTPEDFPGLMDRQIEELRELLGNLSETDLGRDATHVTGQTLPLGDALATVSYPWMSAYKLQLFLYAKQSGNSEIGTMNAWAGQDAEPRA